jgi:flagellar biosynthesis GTPase FlhF
LRAIFNVFELVGNAIAMALGKFLEELGSWVDSDLEQFGKDFQANAIAAGEKNLADLKSAGQGVARAASAAVFGGSGMAQATDGPASRAVAAARERFARRNDPAAAAERERERAARAAQQEQAAAAAAAKRAAEEAKKAEEERLKVIQQADEAIAKAEEDRSKRAAEIEADRLDALSRRSNEALNVGDIRSGGISEVLRIATGRDDPAIEEYRKQLSELRKIEQRLRGLEAEKVAILG